MTALPAPHQLGCLCGSCTSRRSSAPGAPPPSTKSICAWCKAHLRGPADATVVSHGLCATCKVKALAEAEAVRDRVRAEKPPKPAPPSPPPQPPAPAPAPAPPREWTCPPLLQWWR